MMTHLMGRRLLGIVAVYFTNGMVRTAIFRFGMILQFRFSKTAMVAVIVVGFFFDAAMLVKIMWSMSPEAKWHLLDFLRTLQSIMMAKSMLIEDLLITRLLSYQKNYDNCDLY